MTPRENTPPLASRLSRTPVRSLLNRFARPRWRAFLGGLLALVVGLVLQRVPPLVIGVALDALYLNDRAYALPLVPASWIPEATDGQTLLTVGILGAAILGETAAKWYGSLVYEVATHRTLHEIRTAAYETATSLSMAFYDERDGGDVLSVLNDDVDNLGDLFFGARDGVRYGGNVLTAFAFMLVLNWNLALVLASLPVAMAALGRVYASLLAPRYTAVRESIGTMNVRLRDAVEGLSTVKAYSGESRERDRVAEASAAFKRSRWSTLRLRAVYNRVSWLVGAVGIWGLFLLGGYWILAGAPLGFSLSLTPGTLLTFIIYTISFLDPTRRLAVDVIDKLESARASAERVVSVFESDSRLAEPGGDRDLTVEAGRVEYDEVTVSYPSAETETLSDVSFAAEAGEFVGIVGPTGAGKSTLTKLLFRFYDPDAGHVRVDGRDVSAVSVESLRDHVGYVGQEPFLFPGSVSENVGYADPDADRETVVRAAKRAGAHEFVADLPEGYDTQVGERGVSLSGGQRQRIAIARALASDPSILVFDEATSHVDNETELDIQRRLRAASGDRTVFAIAHRLSTVRRADRILVVEDGRIVERGSHEELLERGGTYATLWNVQTGNLEALATDDAGQTATREPEAADG